VYTWHDLSFFRKKEHQLADRRYLVIIIYATHLIPRPLIVTLTLTVLCDGLIFFYSSLTLLTHLLGNTHTTNSQATLLRRTSLPSLSLLLQEVTLSYVASNANWSRNLSTLCNLTSPITELSSISTDREQSTAFHQPHTIIRAPRSTPRYQSSELFRS
jgi:hypothetical protein